MTAVIFVGRWEDRPPGVERLRQLDYIHPKDYASELASRTPSGRWWTNDALIVRCFPAEQVWLCLPGSRYLQLSRHPNWDFWKDEFDAGEFWSLVDPVTGGSGGLVPSESLFEEPPQ